MNLKLALTRLSGRDDWNLVLDYLADERNQAIGDFQSGDLLDNPTKLARLSGEIAALDRVHQVLRSEPVQESEEGN